MSISTFISDANMQAKRTKKFKHSLIAIKFQSKKRDECADLKERRFHPFKTEWGIPRAIGLSTFHDISNGFLLNDCCMLGAEVFVLKGDNKAASFSMMKPQTIRTFTWRVAELKELICSPYFAIEGRQWYGHLLASTKLS